jgi:hypothetical protein
MRLFVLLAITTLAFSACNNSSKHLDANGALLVDFLTYQDGEGTYTNGIETGMWTTYYRKDYPKMMKFYDEKGYLLMRKEYFDNGKVKNYQNVKSPKFGDLERRVQFNYKGEVEYIDAERELGRLEPAAINKLLQDNGLMVK